MSGGSGSHPAPLYPILYEPLIRRALEEDLGRAGDLTSDAVLPQHLRGEGRIVARAAGRLAGLPMALSAFRILDPEILIETCAADGEDVEAGAVLAIVKGAARSLLSTRKTTPGLRALEKYAVRCGGGHNHRFGLDDAVLIKDNHIAFAGGLGVAVERARVVVGHLVKIEVEVDSLEMLREALDLKVDVVLLDNMSVETLAQAVALARGRALTEASGGITPDTAAAIAATGVDMLSMGWLTHSAPSLDVALDVDG